jgi:tetratricopeptide (TPR) repeat protein
MRRPARTLAAWLVLVVVALPADIRAATPLPLEPPLPDLTGLVPFAATPLDKPRIELPPLTLPPTPEELPPLPLAGVEVPSDKPIAVLPPARPLACAGRWLGIASEQLECGRARYQRAEYDEAVRALDAAVRGASDPETIREARYWLAESLWRLGRFEQADLLFRQVAQDRSNPDLRLWAQHASGWTALRLGDAARAQDAFTPLLNAFPPVLDAWSRAGLAIALYQSNRFAEAERAWAELTARAVPAALRRDVAFWYGETLGRVGNYARAESELGRFVAGGVHPLLDAGLLRLGWWTLAAGRFAESAGTLRTYLSVSSRGMNGVSPRERDWADAGLALALLAAGDVTGAQAPLRALQSRRSPLATPVLLRMTRVALDARRAGEAQRLVQDLLGARLSGGARAWVLIASGEAYRLDGKTDDARTQFDLARTASPGGPTAPYAVLRLAQTNFEMREFAQAVSDVAAILPMPLTGDMRAAALLLQGEAAYAAGDYATAEAAYTRALTEAPSSPQAPLARLSLGWTALRRDRSADARRIFTEFAQAAPADPHAADALVIAAEMALESGDLEGGRQLLERTLSQYPNHPRAPFARLNRAIVLVRTGKVVEAQPDLRTWITRTPFAPLLGRAEAALGVALLAARLPADAAKELAVARREGVGALAALGLGVVKLTEKRWDEATRDLSEARDTGTARITATAEYALAVAAFHRGAIADFKKRAADVLAAAPAGPMAPRLLYVLTGIAAQEKDWKTALASARRLADAFAADEAADDALERVGAAAASVPVWPVVHESYALLRQKFPQSPFVADSRFAFGLALVETKRAAEGRGELEAFVAAAPNDPRAAQAYVALARAREATGDRKAALDAYTRAAGDGRGTALTTEAGFSSARLLLEDRRWAEARVVLGRLVKSDDASVAARAALAIGETYQREGEHLGAAEYFMTAAYLEPTSSSGRQGLLGAGQSFATLKQPEAAATVYRKLLAQPDLPADVADAARKGLAAVTR